MTDTTTLGALTAPPDWMDRAICAQTDPEAFYPDVGESSYPAKAICRRCPVIVECLGHALNTNERHGIWGGTTPRERRIMAKKARRPPVTKCVNGHPYTPWNTYTNPSNGKRQCRTCMSDRQSSKPDNGEEATA